MPSGEEVEGVLHPVIQEDELTLILVGAFLGLLAGFAQAAFFYTFAISIDYLY